MPSVRQILVFTVGIPAVLGVVLAIEAGRLASESGVSGWLLVLLGFAGGAGVCLALFAWSFRRRRTDSSDRWIWLIAAAPAASAVLFSAVSGQSEAAVLAALVGFLFAFATLFAILALSQHGADEASAPTSRPQ